MTLPTYLGSPVLDWQPDWRDPSRVMRLVQDRTLMGEGLPSPLMVDAPWQPRPRTHVRMRYVLETRAEMLAARELVRDTLQGRRKNLWVPLWSQAVHLALPADEADTTITITRSLYSRMYAGAGRGREHLAIFPADGSTPICRKVTASEELDEATEELTLSSSPGVDLPAETFISFLLFVRLDTDSPTLQWDSMVSGILEIPFIDLPVMTP